MKANRDRKDRKNEKGFTSFLIQVHSFVLNLVLCSGLYTAHLPLAYAQDSNLEALVENANSTGASSSDLTSTGTQETTATVGTSGSSEGGGQYTKIEGENVDPTAKMLLGNIALFAATMAAPILLKQCPSAVSVWIYSASAALYLANEVGLFTRFKNASDAEMAAYLGRGDEDKQIQSLETAAEQTDKAVKAAKRRALVAKIAATGFAAASAMAIAENYWDWAKSAAGDCGKKGTEGSVDIEELLLNKNINIDDFDFRKNTKIDTKLLVMNSDNFDFMMSYREQANFLDGELQSISIDDYEQQKRDFGEDINHFSGLKSALVSLTEISMSFVSATAQAEENGGESSGDKKEEEKKSGINWTGSGMKALTGMLGAGAGLILAQEKFIEHTNFVKTPISRAVGFGGFTVFAYGSATESEDAAKKLEKRSQEYRKLANTLRTQIESNTTNTNAPAAQTIAQTSSGTGDDDSNSSDDNFCITGNKVNNVNVDLDCQCASANSCKKTQVPDLSAMPEFAGQSLLSDSVKSLKSAGDSLYAGRLEGASTAANGLSKNAARISKLRDALVKKINLDNKAAGGKDDLDLNKLENKFADQMLKKVNSGFNNLSAAEQARLASFAPALGDSDKTADDDSKKKDDPAAGDPAVGGTGQVAGGAGSGKKNAGTSWDFNFDEEDKSGAVDPEAAALAKAMAEEDGDYMIEGDINDDRNKDIFKIITGRYLKSAYPVIFEEQ